MVDDEILENAKSHGYFLLQPSVSPLLLRRIQDGALASRFTQQAIQDAVRATLGIR